MHPVRKRKLLLWLSVILALSVASGLVLYALRQNISLFYTPTQLMQGEVIASSSIRVGGVVVEKSIQHNPKNLAVKFKITDYKNTIEILYTGILPDLFREKQGVVAQGEWLGKGKFRAVTILAKHDENYMPPEVQAALKG
jgi:cytochrome c-type biogenesis protein CcmE